MLDAPGNNVVGYLPGERAGAPIVVGAHHDGWFSAAFDNASGVAAVLALARALATAGHRPRHTLCFTSRTAEEYGLTDSAYGWCTGAWAQISETHRAWAAGSPFHLNLEASGHPALRLLMETPPRADAVGAPAGAHGRGRGLADERLVHARAPGHRHRGVAVPDLGRSERVRLHLGAVVHAHRLPHAVRHGRDDRLRASRAALPLLRAAPAERRRRSRAASSTTRRGRASSARRARALGAPGEQLARRPPRGTRPCAGARAFTPLGRGLNGLDAHGTTTYPHTQAARDVERLEAALEALGRDDRRTAIRQLSRVGDNALARTLSEEVFATRSERGERTAPARLVGREEPPAGQPRSLARARVAARRGRRAAPGPWIERSLKRHLERSRAELARRLAAMTRSLSAAARASR